MSSRPHAPTCAKAAPQLNELPCNCGAEMNWPHAADCASANEPEVFELTGRVWDPSRCNCPLAEIERLRGIIEETAKRLDTMSRAATVLTPMVSSEWAKALRDRLEGRDV